LIGQRSVRYFSVAAALIVVWVLVLSWAARLPWYSPWSPRQSVTLNGIDFKPGIGAAVEDGEALGVGAISEDGNALQTTSLDRLRAADFPILRYRFDDFPDTLELSLVFRRTDAADDIAYSLPFPGKGVTSVDLSTLPDWRGEITEFAFAEYAAAQAVPPSIAFKPFRIQKAELQSRSWHSVPGLLHTAWFGFRPWALLSVSALGPAIESIGTSSVLPAIIWGSLFSLIAAALILQWSRREVLRNGAIVAALLWIFLDVRWLDDLAAKHRLSETVYAGKPWFERVNLQPDERTPAIAKIVQEQLSNTVPTRVLVASDSTFSLLRMIYFLLPFNAAPLDHGALVTGSPLPAGSAIVTYNTAWQYEPASSMLIGPGKKIPVEQIYATQEFGIYRVTGDAQ
jgi:hypothetical protein